LENSYLARFRSDFGEFRVYVIVVTSRMFLYTFQTVFLLVVYCSNYSPLFASCMIARMIICCCLVSSLLPMVRFPRFWILNYLVTLGGLHWVVLLLVQQSWSWNLI